MYSEGAERQLVNTYRSAVSDGFEISEDWVRNRLSEGRGLFSQFYTNCDNADNYYDATFPMDLPENAQHVRLPTLRASINSAMSQLASGHIDIGVPPRTLKSEGEAERVERFLENTHAGLESRYPTDEMTLIMMLLYGVAWKKLRVNVDAEQRLPSFDVENDSPAARRAYTDAVHEELERSMKAFPFMAEWIDPREMMWDYASGDPRWVIWTHRVDATWVLGNFPEWYPSPNYVGNQYIEMSEVWTPNQVAYYADDRWVMRPRNHPLGMIPFVKYHPTLNRPTRIRRPDDMYRGVGYSVYELLEAQSRLLNQHLDINYKASWPPLEIKGVGPQAERIQESYDTAPDARNIVPPYIEVVRGEAAEVPYSLQQAKDMIDGAIQGVLFSNVTAGTMGPHASSGHLVSVLQGIASLNLTPTKNAFERGKIKENEIVLRTVERVLRRKVSVFGSENRDKQMATIGPQDIKEHYFTTVNINADAPDEQERKMRLNSDLVSMGFLDHLTGLRRSGVPQPQEVIFQVMMENLVKSDPVQMQLIQSYLPRLQILSQRFNAIGDTEGEMMAAEMEQNIANQILGQQQQQANPGQFSAGNQAGITPITPGSGAPGTSNLPTPGSGAGADLINRQRQVSPGSGDRIPA